MATDEAALRAALLQALDTATVAQGLLSVGGEHSPNTRKWQARDTIDTLIVEAAEALGL